MGERTPALIELIPFTEADIDRLIGWIPSLESLLVWTASSFGYPLTHEHLQGHLRDSAARGDRLIFKAVDADSREAVGHIELGALDPRNRSLRIGRVLLAPAVRGRGLGAAMMRTALARAFGEQRAHRVELGVFDVNPRAIRCYERVGFRREGVRRDSFKVPEEMGGYWSEITMSVLAPEWEAPPTPPRSTSPQG
jgi:RimJ/RimL family protein N-acetyltransferase